MNPQLARLLCACGIAGLFYLDRDKSVRTSKALWLPALWMVIISCRPELLGIGVSGGSTQLDSNPIDAAIFLALTVSSCAVLFFRGQRVRALLLANWPILLYFIYSLVSVSWSYHPDASFKRWIKAVGDLATVLVIVTDRHPLAAIKRLISAVGFVLLPMSLMLIKYFPDLGRNSTPNGLMMNTGVNSDKNMLGVFLLVISLATLWQVLILWRDKKRPDRGRHLMAQGTLLAFGLVLLKMADSSTSIACFGLGSILVIGTSLRAMRSRPGRVHALCAALALCAAFALLFGGKADVAHALGRQSSLSGRTEIWAAVIPAAVNPIIGAGFEGFWISPNVVKFQAALAGWWHPELLNEAHNGYIEVYLNLGWVGVCIIAMILITGYRRSVKAFRLDPQVGSLTLSYVVVAAVYSVTEAGFRLLDPIWIFLLLASFSATGVATGLFGATERKKTRSKVSAASSATPQDQSIETEARTPRFTEWHGVPSKLDV